MDTAGRKKAEVIRVINSIKQRDTSEGICTRVLLVNEGSELIAALLNSEARRGRRAS